MKRFLRLRRPLLTVFFASAAFAVTLLFGLMGHGAVQTNVVGALYGNRLALTTRVDPAVQSGYELTENVVVAKEGSWSYCDYVLPAEPAYSVALEQVNAPTSVESGSVFVVDMVFKNSGNTRLFAADSGCENLPVLNLGTQYTQDRESPLGKDDLAVSGWLSSNRVQMVDRYVEPEGTFHVIYQSIAPAGDTIYREFYQALVEGVAWVGEPFFVDIPVGVPTEEMKDNITFAKTLSASASDLNGLARNVEVVLSEQMMYARFGETRVWAMKISSGAYDTPTPRGTYKILSKQELRIGGKAPHYRMPYFQLWDSRGYGIHALPYLATDGGTFWSEALTHIGRPVSHGCIRTLPEDAAELYTFTEMGSAVWVH